MFLADRVVAAVETHDELRRQNFEQPALFDLLGTVTGQQHAHRRAEILDHRIGRQRGRQRHHADLGQRFLRQLRDDVADADAEIEARGQAFFGVDDLFVVIDQHRVGKGAAGVDPET